MLGNFDKYKRRGTGKYVLFSLDNPCHSVTLQVFTPEGVKNAIITDTNQIQTLLASIKRVHDGKFVGIFQAAYGETVGAICHRVPACVVPQRPTMVAGGHDLYWNMPGDAMAYRLTIPVLKLHTLELLLDRSDIPTDKVLDPNYDPRKASLVC